MKKPQARASRWVTPPETESLALAPGTARRSVDSASCAAESKVFPLVFPLGPMQQSCPSCYIATIVGPSGHADKGRKLSCPLVRSKDQGLGARDALSLLVVAVSSHFRRVTPHTGLRHSAHHCTTGPLPLRTFGPLGQGGRKSPPVTLVRLGALSLSPERRP